MRHFASVLVAAISLLLLGSAPAAATIRTGTQIDTAAPLGAFDTSISTVTASYDPESGRFEVDVTFQAPPLGAQGPIGTSEYVWIKAMFSEYASWENCWTASSATWITAQTLPGNSASYYHTNKIGYAQRVTDGATVSISGEAPQLTGLNYRCVTVEVDANANGAAENQHPLSILVPDLYFTGYAPSPPAPPASLTVTPAPVSAQTTPSTPQNTGVHFKKRTRTELLAAAIKKCAKLRNSKRSACLRIARRTYMRHKRRRQ